MINLRMPVEEPQLTPRITVIGVGGGGCNAITTMINANLEGVEFLVCNTDHQSLTTNPANRKIQLGLNVTRGLGAGARPDVGRASAEEALEDVLGYVEGSNMVFITAGMGGGTGTGAAPVIARACRDMGILTVGVVTKPFHFEGQHRMRLAESGIEELQDYVDTLLIIPNQNLFRLANEKTTFADAFKMADDVLYTGVRGITDLIVKQGLINLDFADIRSVMTEMGKAMMGTGEAEGERRAVQAAEAAISNPLLEDTNMQGARGVLVNITGGSDMTLFEVDEACNRIRDEVDPDANIIFGATFDPNMSGKMRVSVIATGIDAHGMRRQTPPQTAQVLQAPQTPMFATAPNNTAPQHTQQTTSPAQNSTAAQFGRASVNNAPQQPAATGNSYGYAPANRQPQQQQTPVQQQQPQQQAAAPQQSTAANTAPQQVTAASMQPQNLQPMRPQAATQTAAQHNQGYYAQGNAALAYEPQYDMVADLVEDDNFIPPAPQMVAETTQTSANMTAPAMAQEFLQETTQAPEKKRFSLFEKINGSKQTEADNNLPQGAPLGQMLGANAADRQQQLQFDEDLDIPAFLRRQAS
jgi:cell division protein FtsZ